MRITVNGAPRETRAATLAALLAELEAEQGLRPKEVATAVNGAFAPVSKRAETPLRERDVVEILSPRQGG